MFIVFLKGLLVGLGASIPLGPLGVLTIQKTLSKGRINGFLTGLGASLSDTMFATISLLGLFIIDTFVDQHKIAVLLIGGIVVVFIGLKVYFTNPLKQIKQKNTKSKKVQDFFEGFLMTITNPGSIFLILAMFAAVNFNISTYPEEKTSLVASYALEGIFIGSALWWFTLSTVINIFRKKFRLRQLILLNRLAGIVIMALGAITFSQGLFQLIIK